MTTSPNSDAIARRLAESLAGDPDQWVLAYREATWSRRELRQAVGALETSLAALGLPERAPVGVYMRNRPACVVALAAALLHRRPLVVLSPMLPDATVGDDVRLMRLPAILASHPDWDRAAVSDAVVAAGSAHVVLSDDAPDPIATAQRGASEPHGSTGLSRDVAILMLTSGTTGPPKRVPISTSALEATISNAQAHFVGNVASGAPVRGRGVTIASLPPVNISGLWSLISSLLGGGSLVLLDRFEPRTWAEAVARHHPRSASLPPTALRMVMDAEIPRDGLASLRAIWSGTAPLDPDLADEFEQRYGIAVLATYGATEFTGGIAGWSLSDWKQWRQVKRGSVGRAFKGIDVRIVDPETAEPVVCGQPGIVMIRTAQAATAAPDEWVATNDLGRLDGDGFLWVDGRADDVIIRGGFKVSPVEVERVLCQHPAVADAAVVGIPDDRLGAVPVAIVVPRKDQPSAEELIGWVKGHLQAYKAPIRIVFVDAIPQTTSLKADRRELHRLVCG
jgi:long-chain acyl-CoA synthetase